MANNRSTTHRSSSTVRNGVSSSWLVCLLAVLVLGLGRPAFDMPASLVSEREIDPVEEKDSESEEELAIHFRSEIRRRMFEQGSSVTSRVEFRIAPSQTSCRVAGPFDHVTPHEFDLRNGLGATLRC